jgi:K+-transporting ATPase c subunit
MTSDQTSSNPTNANAAEDPSERVTGEEPMTGPQASYLQTLCQEAGEELDPNLSKAAASQKIDELQQKTGLGQGPAFS